MTSATIIVLSARFPRSNNLRTFSISVYAGVHASGATITEQHDSISVNDTLKILNATAPEEIEFIYDDYTGDMIAPEEFEKHVKRIKKKD